MVVEVEHEGFFSRIMDSIKGFGSGFLLFIFSFMLLWWNEGNIVDEKASLREMQKKMVIADGQNVAPDLTGKVVYVNDYLESEEKLSDKFMLLPDAYLKLKRKVEMFQYVEKVTKSSRKKMGGGKTTRKEYYYEERWKEGREASEEFRDDSYKNPKPKWNSEVFTVKEGYLGAYDATTVLENLNPREQVELTWTKISRKYRKTVGMQDNYLYYPKKALSDPQVGDMRVSYYAVLADDYSVVGVQSSQGELRPYEARNGKIQFLVQAGNIDGKRMFEKALKKEGRVAMILRLVGWIIMLVGIFLMLEPFAVVADIIPILGSLGRVATFLFSFVTSFILSAITIIVGMIAHNPIVLGAVIGVSLIGLVFYFKGRYDKVATKKPSLNGRSTAGKNFAA